MKHQQVVVDYWSMVQTSLTYLLLAFSGYILMKLVQTVFWLPKHLKNNQKMLEDLASKYSLNLDEISEELNQEAENIQGNPKEIDEKSKPDPETDNSKKNI